MSKVQQRRQLRRSGMESVGNLVKAAPLNRIGSFNHNFRQIKRSFEA